MKKERIEVFLLLTIVCLLYSAYGLKANFQAFSQMQRVSNIDEVLAFTKSLQGSTVYILRVTSSVMNSGFQFSNIVRSLLNTLHWHNCLYLLYNLLLVVLRNDDVNCKRSLIHLGVVNVAWLGLFINSGVMLYGLSNSGNPQILIDRLRFLANYAQFYCLVTALVHVIVIVLALRHLLANKKETVL